MSTKTKLSVLTIVAVLFHAIGFVGIGLLESDTILKATPFHLMLMFVLLAISYQDKLIQFLKVSAVIFAIGFLAEVLGVHTGLLFGDYSYSEVLGLKLFDVPLLIGANWVMVIVGATAVASIFWKNKWAICAAAASLATFYDWLLEPVAMDLNYWQWDRFIVPLYNYVCWWGLSFMLVYIWSVFKLRVNNFSAILFTIQALFFALLQIV